MLRFLHECCVGIDAHVVGRVVDVDHVNAVVAECGSEEGVFMSVGSDRRVKANFFENIRSYQEIECTKTSIRLELSLGRQNLLFHLAHFHAQTLAQVPGHVGCSTHYDLRICGIVAIAVEESIGFRQGVCIEEHIVRTTRGLRELIAVLRTPLARGVEVTHERILLP